MSLDLKMASPSSTAKRKAEDRLRDDGAKVGRTAGNVRAPRARYERWGDVLKNIQGVSKPKKQAPTRLGSHIIKSSTITIEDDNFSDDEDGAT